MIKKNVLIIEDEPLLVKILEEKLREQGVNVFSAVDGRAGLTLALEKKPDLIILDILLPYIDGVRVLKRLRSDEWGREVPVLMLTNLSDHRLVKEVQQYHVQGYIIKANVEINGVIDHICGLLCVESFE